MRDIAQSLFTSHDAFIYQEESRYLLLYLPRASSYFTVSAFRQQVMHGMG